jgi:hypothetical protein
MFLILFAVVVIASVVALVGDLRKDGYGSRPVPRSHRDSFPGTPAV